jgi:hypothetical protein
MSEERKIVNEWEFKHHAMTIKKNYCEICGIIEVRLDLHHLDLMKVTNPNYYDLSRNVVENTLTVCRVCHAKLHRESRTGNSSDESRSLRSKKAIESRIVARLQSEESRDKSKESQRGYRRYTNGIVNISTLPGSEPAGFYSGLTKKVKNHMKGCKAYNNGMRTIYLVDGENPPEGFEPGSLKGRKWYTDGEVNVMVIEGNEPAGFRPGVTRKSAVREGSTTTERVGSDA